MKLYIAEKPSLGRAIAEVLPFDLPAGGRRLVQRAGGYEATIKAGEVIFRNGEHTGALPGKLVRRSNEVHAAR